MPMKSNTIIRVLLALVFIMSLALTNASAQNDFSYKPPKTKVQYRKKKIPQRKLDAGKTNRTVRRNHRKGNVPNGDDNVFYEPEKEKSLEEMSDYELEVKGASGNMEAAYLLGSHKIFYNDSTDILVGMRYLEYVAGQGNVEADVLLGYCYHNLDDDVQAVAHYTRAAGQDNPMALYLLGIAYANGEGGLAVSPQQAATCFSKAAVMGLPAAQSALALMLYIGSDIPRDLENSQRWMRQAAESGDEFARQFLEEHTFSEEAADQYVQNCMGVMPGIEPVPDAFLEQSEKQLIDKLDNPYQDTRKKKGKRTKKDSKR